jgi:hypothetical protein
MRAWATTSIPTTLATSQRGSKLSARAPPERKNGEGGELGEGDSPGSGRGPGFADGGELGVGDIPGSGRGPGFADGAGTGTPGKPPLVGSGVATANVGSDVAKLAVGYAVCWLVGSAVATSAVGSDVK